MIEEIQETGKGIIALRAIGKVTGEDYTSVLIPRLESAIQREGKVRFLFHFTDSFRGCDLAALKKDALFGLNHRHDFERIAVVGGPIWIQFLTMLFRCIVPAQIKWFRNQELKDAAGWLAA